MASWDTKSGCWPWSARKLGLNANFCFCPVSLAAENQILKEKSLRCIRLLLFHCDAECRCRMVGNGFQMIALHQEPAHRRQLRIAAVSTKDGLCVKGWHGA
uniref:Uncharacterized protein n=1 Tax=Sphaerodactylus townsendi TaxID=933632 RepID=A0ACB8ECD8_9SAUR